jgi:hypothetical protein
MSPSNLPSPRQVSQDEALLRSSRRTTKTSSPPAPVSLNVTGRISMGPTPKKRHKAGPAMTATSSHGTSRDKGKQKEAPASQEDHSSVGFPPSTSAPPSLGYHHEPSTSPTTTNHPMCTRPTSFQAECCQIASSCQWTRVPYPSCLRPTAWSRTSVRSPS